MTQTRLVFVYCGLLLLLIGCGSDPAPAKQEVLIPSAAPQLLAAPLLANTAPVRLGAITKRAALIHSGLSLATKPGHLLTLSLGFQGPTPRTVQVTGASVEPITLQSGRWQQLQFKAEEFLVSLSFEGGPLFLSQPHLFDANEDKVPNLLLISVDTLRADHFDSVHMPRTFALFSKGLVLDDVYSPTSWTLPAHSSLLSGLYPAIHGVRTPDQKLAESTLTLAEHLREIGYYTAAFTEGNYVSASFGLDQGFLHYQENPPLILGNKAEEVSKLEGTLAALRDHRRQLGSMPQFIFLHTYEVHCPYVPRNGLTDEEGIGNTQWLLDHHGKDLSEAQLMKLKALYAGEVAYTDGLLADLIEELLAEGSWLVALTSDHGEEFGEHGGLLHASTVYEETTHIPLGIVGAGVSPEALIPSTPASIVDIPVTLLNLLALPVPDSFKGRNLLVPQTEPRAVFAESFYFGVHIESKDPMVSGIWHQQNKLIHTRNFGKSEIALYDLAQDPGETNNLQQDQVRERNALFAQLKAYMALKGSDAEKVDNLSAEQIEAMRSLGYIK